jgi:hypothetical protein
MVLSSHQPNFIPYAGLFYKIYKSDVFVVSDDVSYSKSSAHNWNYIYSGENSRKVTVPVNAHHDTRLYEVTLSEPMKSLPRIARTLKESYSKAPHFDEGMEIINIIMNNARENAGLVSLNMEIIMHILDRMRIPTKVIYASRALVLTGHKDERIIQMCRQTGADTYYSGIGAMAYHVEDYFKESGISLVYSDYTPVIYRQGRKEFLPNLSIFDYICNEGYMIPEGWK